VSNAECKKEIMLERVAELKAWALNRKRHHEEDERFHYPPAQIDVNGPLALEQVAMKSEHRCLTAVLNILAGKKLS